MTEHGQPQRVRLIGVPMDLGQKRRGVDMGPSAIRYAGLQRRLRRLGVEVNDGGNITVPVMEEIEKLPDEERAHQMNAIGEVCRRVYEEAKMIQEAGEIGIFMGGDHSITMGTAAASLEQPVKTGVIWVDAHADFNTLETSPSGNVHGMVVAALMGRCPPALTIGKKALLPEQIVMIGTRDLDNEERVKLRESGISVLTMRYLDEKGMAYVAKEALDALGDMKALHVSWDMDSLDPRLVSGVGTPVPGGLTYREAHLLMEMLADDGRVRALDVVEINPIIDRENRTAQIAVELVASMFGQRII